MQVRNIMTQNPTCCTPDMSLQEVARMMMECDCGAIPVVDESSMPMGIITDRDIVVRVLAKGSNPMEMCVRDAMTDSLVTVSADADLEEASNLMQEHQIRRIVVTEGQGIVGILAQADVALHGHDAETADVVQSISQPGSNGTMGTKAW